MIKSVCKLDSRIRSLYDIQTCLEYDDKFINEEGYFAHTLSDFSNLEDCDFGKLVSVSDDNDRYIFNRDNLNRFELFIPECLLLKPKKKYRPFTLIEFLNLYTLGDAVTFRLRNEKDVLHKLFVGYIDDDDKITLEMWKYTFQELFEGYELYNGYNEWVPFGVEVSKDD